MSESSSLLRLQEIDIELLRLNSALKSMPQQKKLAAIDAAQRKLAKNLKQIVGQRKDVEIEIEDNEAAHEKAVRRVGEVQADAAERARDFRGVQDLEAHLTALAKQLEKLEFAHGKLEEKLEKFMRAEQNAEELAARLSSEQAQQTELYKRDTADIRARARLLMQERTQLEKEISEATMARYCTAYKRFGGLAVERLRGNVPSVCRVKLQPGLFHDLMHGEAISECPYCHRMLVTEGALADE